MNSWCDSSCPLWVNNGHRSSLKQCPLYIRKRTLVERVGMSASCKKRKSDRRRAKTAGAIGANRGVRVHRNIYNALHQEE
jgi:hypothetical protein